MDIRGRDQMLWVRKRKHCPVSLHSESTLVALLYTSTFRGSRFFVTNAVYGESPTILSIRKDGSISLIHSGASFALPSFI